jgi:hypothetical protein
MGYEDKYCIVSCSSIGGCPLEEARKHCFQIQSVISIIILLSFQCYCGECSIYIVVILPFLAFYFCSAYILYLVYYKIGEDPFHNRIHCMVFLYPKGLIVIKEIIHIFLVYMLWYLVFSLWFLTSSIRALSLADIVGKYFLFSQIFFFGEEKIGQRNSRHFRYIFVKNL